MGLRDPSALPELLRLLATLSASERAALRAALDRLERRHRAPVAALPPIPPAG